GHRSDEGLDALAHLVGGLVGERDGEDPEGADAALADEVGNAMGEHPGLPRARAGDDEERTLAVDDSVELVGVEAVGPKERHDTAILRARCDRNPVMLRPAVCAQSWRCGGSRQCRRSAPACRARSTLSERSES